MKSHYFADYLDKYFKDYGDFSETLSAKDPRKKSRLLLAESKEKFAENNFNPIVRILNSFPLKVSDDSPANPVTVRALMIDFNILLNTVQIKVDEEKGGLKKLSVKDEKDILFFIKKMFKDCCTELLNEKGHLHLPIARSLGIESMSANQTMISSLIISYAVEIMLNAVIQKEQEDFLSVSPKQDQIDKMNMLVMNLMMAVNTSLNSGKISIPEFIADHVFLVNLLSMACSIELNTNDMPLKSLIEFSKSNLAAMPAGILKDAREKFFKDLLSSHPRENKGEEKLEPEKFTKWFNAQDNIAIIAAISDDLRATTVKTMAESRFQSEFLRYKYDRNKVQGSTADFLAEIYRACPPGGSFAAIIRHHSKNYGVILASRGPSLGGMYSSG